MSIEGDNWHVTGYDPSYEGDLIVPEESSTVPVQQEAFETLGRNRKVVMRGFALGHEGTLTAVWEEADTASALNLLNYLADNRGPHLLENPFGESFYVEFGSQTRKWLSGGHLQVDLEWIEVTPGTGLTMLFLDNFARTLSDDTSIGDADIPVAPWFVTTFGSAGTLSVDGSELVWDAESSFLGRGFFVSAGDWADGLQDFTLTAKFSATINALGVGEYAGISIAVGDDNIGVAPAIEVIQEDANQKVAVYGSAEYEFSTLTMESDADYIVVWNHSPSTNTSRVKMYKVGSGDPGWLATRVTSTDSYTPANFLSVLLSGKSTTVPQWRIDYIRVV